jgi:hypothetical protein
VIHTELHRAGHVMGTGEVALLGCGRCHGSGLEVRSEDPHGISLRSCPRPCPHGNAARAELRRLRLTGLVNAAVPWRRRRNGNAKEPR